MGSLTLCATMLPRTKENLLKLCLVNFSKHYLYKGMVLLGLMPLFQNRQGVIVNNRFLTAYSILVACLFSGIYVFSIYDLQTEPSVQNFYVGVPRVTLTIQCLVSLCSIATFYSIAIWQRREFAQFYNRMVAKYQTYGCFYQGRFVVSTITSADVDSENEMDSVYLPIFMKTIVVHFLTLGFIGAVSYRNWLSGKVPVYKYLSFFGLPYLVQSLTTSFLYLSATRTSFKYQKMNDKILQVRQQLRTLTQSKGSAFERMTRCCEISDLIDELAQCYQSVNETANELLQLYKSQMVCCLLYSLIHTLHRLFVLYLAVYITMINGTQFDGPLLAVNLTHVLLGIVELVLVINATELCHWGSVKVGRTVQSLIHFEHLDIRLRQSVRELVLGCKAD